jgi:tetratricopeptide (TPR) repeat protein
MSGDDGTGRLTGDGDTAALLSADAITAADPAGLCGPLLETISLLSPAGVRREMLHLAGKEGLLAEGQRTGRPWRRDSARRSSAKVDAALARLRDASLLESDDATVTAQPAIAEAIRSRLLHGEAVPAQVFRTCHLLDAYRVPEPRRNIRTSYDFTRQVTAFAGHLDGTPAKEAHGIVLDLLDLRCQAVWYLEELGQGPEPRIALAEPLLADCTRLLHKDHPYTVTARSELADAYRSSGRPADAIPLYEQNLAAQLQIPGPDHPDTLSTQNNLAAAYQLAGRPADAIPLYKAALAGLERTRNPDFFTVRKNLASAREAARGDTGE